MLHYEEGLKGFEQLKKTDPTDAEALRDVMIGYYKLGEVRFEQNEFNDAIEHFTKGVAVLDRMIENGMNESNSRKEKELLESRIQDCRDLIAKES